MEKDSSSWGGGLPKHPPCSLDSLHSTQKGPGTLLMPPAGCSIPTPGLWGCKGWHLPGDQLRSSCSLPRGAASGICFPTLS